MKRAYHITVRVFAVFGVAVFCVIIWYVVTITWKMPVHNFDLWRLGRNFQSIDSYHPVDSRLLLKNKYVGGLYPEGSYSCNYFVGEFRSAAQSREEIIRAYGGHFVDSFDGTGRIPVEIRFLDDQGFFDHHPWYEWQKKLRQSPDLSTAQGSVYLVFASQIGYPPYGDIRCN